MADFYRQVANEYIEREEFIKKFKAANQVFYSWNYDSQCRKTFLEVVANHCSSEFRSDCFLIYDFDLELLEFLAKRSFIEWESKVEMETLHLIRDDIEARIDSFSEYENENFNPEGDSERAILQRVIDHLPDVEEYYN